MDTNTVWNVCDSGNTTQGIMSDILGKLFNIKTGFYGVLISNFARLNLSSIVDEANDKHMKPWNELCARNEIRATPLDPYMDKELLSSNHLYIDGTAITTKTGFQYKYEKVTLDLIREVVLDAIDQKLFPNILEKNDNNQRLCHCFLFGSRTVPRALFADQRLSKTQAPHFIERWHGGHLPARRYRLCCHQQKWRH